MKKTLLAITVSTLTLSSVATAGSGCGTHKSGYPRAVMAHGITGAPQASRADNDSQMTPSTHEASATQAQKTAAQSIVEVAASAGSFNTLITAVKAAGLADTLTGEGPFTVFAPTDEAFAKLPAGTLDGLLADKTKLIQILTYHVVPGKLDASAVTGASKLATVEGSELPVAGIKIAQTDVMASNGVIHVIDEVLIPEA